MEEDLEAPIFLPDPVLDRDLYVVEEQLVRLTVEHGPDRRPFDPLRFPEVDEEEAETVRSLRALFEGRRPRDEDHQIALLDAGDENLVASDPVPIALALRNGRDASQVAARVGLGQGEALHAKIAAGEGGQVRPLDAVGGEAGHEEGEVILAMERLCIAAPGMDLLEDEGRVRQRAAGAAVRLRQEEGPKSLGLELGHEFLWIRLAVLQAHPVVRTEAVHEATGRREQKPLGLIQREGHPRSPPSSGP